MAYFKEIIILLDEEIKRVNNSTNLEQLLKKSDLLDDKQDFIKYLSEIENNEQVLSSMLTKTCELSTLIERKSMEFHEENSKKMITSERTASEEIEEEIALEKANLNLQYLEQNSLTIELYKAIKYTEESIQKITKIHADAVSDVELCKRNLQKREVKINEIEKEKQQKEAARRAIEQLELEKLKQEAKDAEIRKREMEHMKMILEEEEANKLSSGNSQNFQTIRFDVANGEFGESAIGCFIKTLQENMGVKEDFVVELLDPLMVHCDFDATDEIVSNIIEIRPSVVSGGVIQFSNAFSIILPHSMARTQGRETKIFRYDKEESKWISHETSDITMDDVDKTGARFVETIFNELPLIITVLSVPKVEDVEYGKKGNNWSASVDSRVNVIIPSNAVKVNLKMKITTLVFDSTFTQDVKTKSKGTAVDNIYTFTHLLKIESPKRRLLKSSAVSLPLAQKQATKSDSVPMPVLVSNADSRPKTNFGAQTICDLEDEVRLLSIDNAKQWQQNKDFEIEIDKKKDCIKFNIPEFRNMTFLGVRVKPEASPEQISKGVSIIMEHFKMRQIKITVTNSVEDPNLFVVMVCPVSRMDKQLRLLHDEGYNDKSPLLSQEIEIKEREILSVRLRGNIKTEGKEEEFVYKFMYCSQLKNRIKLRLDVVDKYAQRVKSTYQGFLTVTMSTWSKKPQPKVEGQTRKGPPVMIDIEEIIPLYEVLLSIPKISDTSKSISMKDKEFNFASKDAINSDFIRRLAAKIRNDWKSLAKALDLSTNRIEEISCLCVDNKNKDELAYEVLRVWIMNLPVSKNKEQILKKALININREDLVDKMLKVSH